jgi:hypothetical protein
MALACLGLTARFSLAFFFILSAYAGISQYLIVIGGRMSRLPISAIETPHAAIISACALSNLILTRRLESLELLCIGRSLD